MNIDHIVLWVDNQQHSLAFFVDLLGMERIGILSYVSARGPSLPGSDIGAYDNPLVPAVDFRPWRARSDHLHRTGWSSSPEVR